MSNRLNLVAGLLTLILIASAAVGAEVTAYVGATVVDPGANTVIPDGVVIVTDKSITAVGESRAVAIPGTARIVQLRGKWIVPGYIDVHTHIASEGDARSNGQFFNVDMARRHESESEGRARLSSLLARHLRSGTTTILDIGGPEWTLSLRAETPGDRPWPRVLAAGPIIGPPRPNFGVEADQDSYKTIRTPEEARAAVRKSAARKPDMMKFYLVPAEQTGKPFEELLPMFKAAFDEAKTLGVRTTAHALRSRIAQMGVAAGVDTLAHGIMDAPVSDAFVKEIREHGVVLAPTLMVAVGPFTTMTGTLNFTAEEKAWGDPDAIADLLKASERVKTKPRDPRRTLLEPGTLAVALRNTKILSDAGIVLAVGTDAGILGILHGPSILHEFQLMNKAGLTPREILAAATLGGAKFLKREADLGGIAPGKLADMVVLDADPLADIRNASRIDMVIVNGRSWKADEILSGKPTLAPR